jgi:uncharacterized repeat protein (TIGR01451 family)
VAATAFDLRVARCVTLHRLQIIICGASLTIFAASHAEGATCVWTGAAANANWNQSGNWSSCTTPAAGDDLIFPDGAARLTNTNNVAGTLALRSITFSGAAGGYILQGNPISLAAGLTSSNTASTNRVSLTVNLAASQTISETLAGAGSLLLQHQTSGQPVIQLNGFTATFDGAGTITVAGPGSITTAGALFKTGLGQTNLNAANAGFTGPTSVDAGTLSLGDVAALGTADGTSATGVTVNGSAVLNVAVTGTVANKLLTLTGTITAATFSTTATAVIWSGPIAFTGTADVRACGTCAAPTTLSGPISGSGAFRTGSATTANLGVLILANSANNFSATTEISLSPSAATAGTLRLGAGDVIPNSSALTVLAPRRFDVNGQLETIGSLAGDGPVLLGTGGVLTVGGNNTSTTYSGVMTGAGAAKLVKRGSGTMTLAAANTHPLTVVQAGTVLANGTAPTMAISLTGGTLGGTGRTGAVTGTSGAIAPGAGAGLTSVLATGALTLGAATAVGVDLNGTTLGTGYDQIDVTGVVTLGGATLSVALGFAPPPFSTFTIINNDSTDAVIGTFAGLPQGARLTAGGVAFSISYTGGTGNDVVLTSLPLPPTATADAGATAFGGTVVLTPAANDAAGSGATLVASAIDLDPGTPGQQTTHAVIGEGVFTLNTGTGQVTFVPDPAFHGVSSIGYTIADNLGQLSNVALLAVTVLAPVADVSISKTGSATVTPGSNATVTYTIVVTNAGPYAASTVIVNDTTPGGLTFVSATGDCATPFPCTLGTLPMGATRAITATYAVPASYTGPATIVNTATVSTTASTDSNSGNNTATTSTTVTPKADLAITQTGPALTAAGTEIVYTLVITNNGPSDAVTVTVTDPTPADVTFVRTTGACTSPFPCVLGTLPAGESRTIAATFKVPAAYAGSNPIVNAAQVSSVTPDPVSTNNAIAKSTRISSSTDSDGNGLPDSCEATFGLNPSSGLPDDAADGDPDGDGRTNAQECAEGTHPRGLFKRYMAEGVTSTFFDMEIELLNPTDHPALVLLEYQLQTADPTNPHPNDFLVVPANARRSVDPKVTLPHAAFSTIVESDVPVIVERTVKWDAHHYGSHAESSQPSPETVWYLAEGATHGAFNLFYLIQNPNDADTSVEVTYLRPAPKSPIVKTYQVRGKSRLTIWVDAEGPEFEAEELSAVFHADLPIMVERSMYVDAPGQVWAGGTSSAAVHAPAPQWFFAEGATGGFFDTFFLLANPNAHDVAVRATYLLYTGDSFTKDYTVSANSRFTIGAGGDDPRLANTAFSTRFDVIGGVDGIIAERTMWWPASLPWIEGHNSTGVTMTGTAWAIAEGEVGGADVAETYVLVANTSAFAGSIRVRALADDGTTVTRTFPIAASTRFNINIRDAFPEMVGKKFGTVIESLGDVPAQITAEVSVYLSADGVTWSAGSNAPATRLR